MGRCPKISVMVTCAYTTVLVRALGGSIDGFSLGAAAVGVSLFPAEQLAQGRSECRLLPLRLAGRSMAGSGETNSMSLTHAGRFWGRRVFMIKVRLLWQVSIWVADCHDAGLVPVSRRRRRRRMQIERSTLMGDARSRSAYGKLIVGQDGPAYAATNTVRLGRLGPACDRAGPEERHGVSPVRTKRNIKEKEGIRRRGLRNEYVERVTK